MQNQVCRKEVHGVDDPGDHLVVDFYSVESYRLFRFLGYAYRVIRGQDFCFIPALLGNGCIANAERLRELNRVPSV